MKKHLRTLIVEDAPDDALLVVEHLNREGYSLQTTRVENPEDFRKLFKDSPISRIKRRGFLRNVCVALGNVGDGSDLPALARAAADPEPLIAEHAAWAIKQIQ